MRDIKALVVGTGAVAAIVAVGIFHPWFAGVAVLGLFAALLLPPALLTLLLRAAKFHDRHSYVRLVRPALSQAFPPAAFGNSSGGRNAS